MTQYADLVPTFGRVGRDAVVRSTGEKEVVSFSLATTRSFDRDDPTSTTWYDVEVWSDREPLFSNVRDGVRKGQLVAVLAAPKPDRESGGKVYKKLGAFNVYAVSDLAAADASAEDF